MHCTSRAAAAMGMALTDRSALCGCCSGPDIAMHIMKLDERLDAVATGKFGGSAAHLQYFLDEVLKEFVRNLSNRTYLYEDVLPRINKVIFQKTLEIVAMHLGGFLPVLPPHPLLWGLLDCVA